MTSPGSSYVTWDGVVQKMNRSSCGPLIFSDLSIGNTKECRATFALRFSAATTQTTD